MPILHLSLCPSCAHCVPVVAPVVAPVVVPIVHPCHVHCASMSRPTCVHVMSDMRPCRVRVASIVRPCCICRGIHHGIRHVSVMTCVVCPSLRLLCIRRCICRESVVGSVMASVVGLSLCSSSLHLSSHIMSDLRN